MQRRRVLLVCSQYLFGAGIENILRSKEDVELIGSWGLEEDICQKIAAASPDVVLIVDDDSQGEAGTNLTTAIMETYPNLSIIRARLTENVVRVHSTHILPASGADLLETIRNLPETGISSSERSKRDDDGKI